MKTSTQFDILAPLNRFPVDAACILAQDIKSTQQLRKLLLESTFYKWHRVEVATFEQILQGKQSFNVDIVLLVFDRFQDVNCEKIVAFQERFPNLPIVVVINSDEAPFYYQLIECGIQDCLTTPLLNEPFLTHTLLNAHSRHQILNKLVAETNFSAALREIAIALNSIHNLEEVMNKILDTIGYLIPHTAANIALIEGDACRIAYQKGYDPNILPSGAFFPLDWHAWLIMYQSQKPFLIADTQNSAHWYASAKLDWIKSYLGAPIISHGNVIGFLNLDSEHPNFFNEWHLYCLGAFADQVAIAVSNAETYQTLESNNQEIAKLHRGYSLLMVGLNEYQTIDEMANLATKTITETFGHTDCGLMLVDDHKQKLIRVARNGTYGLAASEPLPLDGKGLAVQAVKTQQTIYVPDVRQDERYIATDPRTQTELVIPLLINKDEVLGVLDLQSPKLNAFTERDIQLLEVFASRVAIMLDNVRLYEALRNHASILEEKVKQRTSQLRRTLDQIEAIFNNSLDAIILTYPDGQIRQTNPSCDALFGYKADILFGQQIEILFSEEDYPKLKAAQEHLVKHQRYERIELLAKRSDGTTFPADVAISLIYDDKGWQRILYSLRDMTQLKEAEEQLAKALAHQQELNNLRTRFIRAMNHEFKNPLTALLTQTENLVHYWDRLSDETRQQKIRKIYDLLLYQREQLEDILNLERLNSRAVNFDPQPLDVVAFCQTIIERLVFALQSKHPIDFQFKGENPTIIIDRAVLDMVLSNLISNAIKYSPNLTPISISLEIENAQLMIRVTDQGIGIPPEAQLRLFQPFFRAANATDFKGTGLGLSLIKAYIESYGGVIRFESNVDEGTIFEVRLPIKVEETK